MGVDSLIEDHGQDGLWKLILGRQSQSGWQGPEFPNVSTRHWNSSEAIFDCGLEGCLFRLDRDPSEYTDLAQEEPVRAAAMLANLTRFNGSTFSPHRGQPDMAAACKAAIGRYHGFWGPFVDIALLI